MGWRGAAGEGGGLTGNCALVTCGYAVSKKVKLQTSLVRLTHYERGRRRVSTRVVCTATRSTSLGLLSPELSTTFYRAPLRHARDTHSLQEHPLREQEEEEQQNSCPQPMCVLTAASFLILSWSLSPLPPLSLPLSLSLSPSLSLSLSLPLPLSLSPSLSHSPPSMQLCVEAIAQTRYRGRTVTN